MREGRERGVCVLVTLLLQGYSNHSIYGSNHRDIMSHFPRRIFFSLTFAHRDHCRFGVSGGWVDMLSSLLANGNYILKCSAYQEGVDSYSSAMHFQTTQRSPWRS